MICSNWTAPAIADDLSKAANRARDIAKGTKVKMAAIYLINLEESPGTRAIMRAPITGRKIMTER